MDPVEQADEQVPAPSHFLDDDMQFSVYCAVAGKARGLRQAPAPALRGGDAHNAPCSLSWARLAAPGMSTGNAGGQAGQPLALFVQCLVYPLAYGLGVGHLAAAEVVVAGIAPVAQRLASVAQLQPAVAVLGNVDHCSGFGRLHLAGLDLQDLPFKAAAQLGAELALMVQRADAGQLVRATQCYDPR